MHLECWCRVERIVSCTANEVAYHADVRVQCLGSSTTRSTESNVVTGSRGGRRFFRRYDLRWYGRRRRRGSGAFRSRLWSLGFELAYLTFQRDEAIFKITDLLLQSRNVITGIAR